MQDLAPISLVFPSDGVASIDTVATSLLFLGGFLLAFGLYSQVIKDFYLSETLLSTLFGILLGPKVLNLVQLAPAEWDEGLAEDAARNTLGWICRVVIGVQVLFAASTLPSRYLLKPENVRSMTMLLLPVMTAGWLISCLLTKLCLPKMPWMETLIIGACISPTDPVLANSIVKGVFAEQHVPRHVRELLAAESGLNDGFGTPFLFVPLFAIINDFNVASTTRDFLVHTVIWDVLLGSALGICIGYVARKALKLARRHNTIDRESMLVFSLALSLFTVGLGSIIETNSLLACFFAGTALNWTDKIRAEDLHSRFSEGVELFFDTSMFLLLGTLLPFDTWFDPDFLPPWNLLALGALVLVFRRLPAVLAFYKFIPQVKSLTEAMFVGYFGPIGVGAIYYALVATEALPDDYEPRNQVIPVVTFIVFCSIVVHGTSAPLIMLAKRLPVRFGSDPEESSEPEPSTPTFDPGETSPLLSSSVHSHKGQRLPPYTPSSHHVHHRSSSEQLVGGGLQEHGSTRRSVATEHPGHHHFARDLSIRSSGRVYPAMDNHLHKAADDTES